MTELLSTSELLTALIAGITGSAGSIGLIILVFKFKAEICNQISELRQEVRIHIGISDKSEKDFFKRLEKLENSVIE